MAIQTGIIQFKGKLGTVIGRKLGNKHIIQEPGGFTSDDHKNNKRSFQRIRENNTEFGRATLFAKAIYNATSANHSRSHRGGNAFTNLVKKTIALQRQLDTVNIRGERRPQPFMLDFLVHTSLNPTDDSTWQAEPTYRLSPPDAALTDPPKAIASIAPPEESLKWPIGANACAFFFYTIEIDFETLERSNNAFTRHHVTDPYANIEIPIPLFEGPCFILAGVEFYQIVNDKHFLLENRAHNPLHIAFAKTE